MQRLRLGTRGSRLARWQTDYIAQCLQAAFPDLITETRVIKTKGDKIIDVPLARIGDKGLFTTEIERELLDGTVDLAVHSLKDLPSQLAAGLCLTAVLKREDPRDVLLSSRGYKIAELPVGAVLGTSSLRRIAQIKAVRPDIKIVELRGNVETRIHKMQEQGLDGIILAYAGVKRLGFTQYITDFIPPQVIMPAVGQGVIALEARVNDIETRTMAGMVGDRCTYLEITAERAFLQELQGGCQVPIGALAQVEGETITLSGLVSSLDGKKVFSGREKGKIDHSAEVGYVLARRLLAQGADKILQELLRK